MAVQQLNLYDASLRPPRVWLTPLRLLVAAALVLGLMAAAAAWLRLDAQRWQDQAAAQQAELQQLAALAPAAAAASDAAALPALRQRLAQAQAMAAAQQAGGPPAMPAEVLAALAAAAPGDVWLTAASWQSEPRQLALEGGLLDPRRLPDYLRRLERQPVFEGQDFAQLQLAPAPALATGSEPAHHRFALRSLPKEARP